MLKHIGYDDLAVVELMTTGIPIVGQLERTGIWPPDPTKTPKISLRAIWASARALQDSVLRTRDDDEWGKDDQELWEETLEFPNGNKSYRK